MRVSIKSLIREEEGVAMVEYALMVALVSAVLVVVVPLLTTAVKDAFATVAHAMTGSQPVRGL